MEIVGFGNEILKIKHQEKGQESQQKPKKIKEKKMSLRKHEMQALPPLQMCSLMAVPLQGLRVFFLKGGL